VKSVRCRIAQRNFNRGIEGSNPPRSANESSMSEILCGVRRKSAQIGLIRVPRGPETAISSQSLGNSAVYLCFEFRWGRE
jgi:hypothetical protein